MCRRRSCGVRDNQYAFSSDRSRSDETVKAVADAVAAAHVTSRLALLVEKGALPAYGRHEVQVAPRRLARASRRGGDAPRRDPPMLGALDDVEEHVLERRRHRLDGVHRNPLLA